MLKIFKQIFKFGIIGLIATIIDWTIFFVLNSIVNIQYLISGLIAFLFSFIFNYILSIKWVFDVKKESFLILAKFVILSFVGLGLNELLLFLFIDKLLIKVMISKVLSSFIVMIYNFITRKIFIEK